MTRPGELRTGKAIKRLGSALLLLPLALLSGPTFGQTSAGEVIHLSGTLSVTRPDGAMLVLGQKSEVLAGDVLLTQKDSYAQINFKDGSSLTMRPLTQVRVEAFSYSQDAPAADNAFFRLLKGGLRTVTGLIGKRGNQNAYRIGTATATIGIRGSIGDTMACAPSCDGVVKGGDTLPPGTHHSTISGTFIMQIGEKLIQIEEGFSGYSNGVDLKLARGGIGDGKVDLSLPVGGGLKGAAGCK